MKFTDSQFVEAVELIQSMDPNKKRRDKRRAPRTQIRLSVDIKICGDAETPWKTTQLRDISPRGLRLETDFEISQGDSFLIRLPAKNGKKSDAPLICRVAHCVKNSKTFTIGADFIGRQAPESSAADSAEQLDRIRRSILD